MTCPAMINRRYGTRDAAWGYLASRGFACGLEGWRNGRWLARVDRDGRSFRVQVWLPFEPSA
ncbi:MAG TPA: hypothetical protein VMB81_29865 [Candidatus Sulfotelmatobacter sp.]|nr:hypothetical protein [Candidatus Sulfotelmatobacter sp.]